MLPSFIPTAEDSARKLPFLKGMKARSFSVNQPDTFTQSSGARGDLTKE